MHSEVQKQVNLLEDNRQVQHFLEALVSMFKTLKPSHSKSEKSKTDSQPSSESLNNVRSSKLLSSQQHYFARDLAKLIDKIHELGLEVSLKDLYRSPECQQLMFDKGVSKARPGKSFHQKSLAIDLVVFENLDDDPELEPNWAFEAYQALGDYWQSLDSKNVWGGEWPKLRDAGHFERRP